MPFNHLIHSHPLLLLPSIFPSVRVFFNVSTLYISSSNEYSGFISFRIDWFDLLAVQGTLRSVMLKLKLQYFGHLMRRTDSLEKTPMLGKIEGSRSRRGQQRMK